MKKLRHPKTLHSIMGNSQKLDGGAMFGNVPKAMWSKWISTDEQNRIQLGCRALLIKESQRNILFETGIGAFFNPKMKERFGVLESEHVLLKSLAEHDLTHEDIDIVVLSHMHFDHAGGLLEKWQDGESARLLFPNAQFVTGKSHFERAMKPHFRDRASFIPELNQLLLDSGRLHLIDETHCALLGSDYRFIFSEGHTPGMMLSVISTSNGEVLFAADLIPGTPWVHLPVTMGYDRFPEALIDEKQKVLSDIHQSSGWLFFTHDSEVALSQVGCCDKGRFSVENTFSELSAWPDN